MGCVRILFMGGIRIRVKHMDTLFSKLIEQVPSAAAIILVTYLFLNAQEKQEEQRIKTSEQQLEHEREINNLWAKTVKQISEEQDKNFQIIIEKIQKHEDESRRRHSKLKARAV